MPQAKTRKKTDRSAVIGAGAAGGGIGSIIAALATSLPPQSVTRLVLTVAAPSIAVLISGIGLFLKTAYVDPYVNKLKHQALSSAMETMLADARAERERIWSDARSTAEHKRKVTNLVQDLEQIKLQRMTERMEIVLSD